MVERPVGGRGAKSCHGGLVGRTGRRGRRGAEARTVGAVQHGRPPGRTAGMRHSIRDILY